MADRICSIGGNDSDAVMHTVCNVCCSPYKKLKVITGFTELPEEVAHIQIPADAGENFEDYLNFPETIEASVVEYKNVDHQKIMRIAIRARKMRKRQQTTVIRKKTRKLLPAVMQRKKI